MEKGAAVHGVALKQGSGHVNPALEPSNSKEKNFRVRQIPLTLEPGKSLRPYPKLFSNPTESKHILSGILGIVIGSLDVHNFVLGNTREDIFHIVANTTCGAGMIIGLIEGIIYLTKSDAEFVQTYQVGRKTWF